MVTYLFCFLMTVVSFNVFSQNHFIGLNGGVVFNNISSKSFNDTNGKPGMALGVSYEYQSPNSFLYGLDVNYQQRGFEINSASGGQISYNFNYLSIPLKVGIYESGSQFFISGNVGIVPARLIKAFAEGPKTESPNAMNSEKNEITGFVKHLDIGALGEVQVGYHVSDMLLLRFQVSYQHGLTSVFGKEFFSNEKGYHSNLGTVLKATWRLNR